MTEEDEIDVLGDFSLDNLLSKNDSAMFDSSNFVSQNTDLLNCEYTIHPQWLLDKPSANPACWYNTTSSDFVSTLSNDDNSNFSIEKNANDNISDESGWTEKEKDLLNRGIEIFGKSNVRLAQFIGSKSAAEVKYFLKNFYSNIEFSCSNSVENEVILDDASQVIHSNDDVIDDKEIPASIEEVIASVTTGETTINDSPKKKSKQDNSVLKPNLFQKNAKLSSKVNKPHKFNNAYGQTNSNIDSNSNQHYKKYVKFKFKANVKMTQKAYKMKLQRKQTKSENSETPTVEIVTGIGLSVPVCDGEQVIRIQKENQDSDSDVDIDIEDVDVSASIKIHQENAKFKNEVISSQEIKPTVETVNTKEIINTKAKRIPDLDELDEDVKEELSNLDIPQEEVKLETNVISKLEKAILYEFFENRPTKTPSRYLTIRNHILQAWSISKPSYVTKTSVRKGLQQCGDVNCIGRIHSYLEQIGAINFGCAQTSYIRPLSELILANKEKPNKEQENHLVRFQTDLPRPRFKSRPMNNGEGGCTIMHNEQGDIINTTVVNEDAVQKARTYMKKPIVKLISCRPFTEENPQKFSIYLHLSALILMDLHAHTSLNEVMGLVGGKWDADQNKLTITRYEPCKNIAPSSTHCDMCPISQANAANILHNENLEILGWFHSHPTFAPEPSQQDLDTQLSVQQWIGNNKPCIGIILSPFSLHGALISSPFRCMIVDRKENFEDQYVPYRFKVDIVSKCMDIDMLLSRAWRIFNIDCNVKEENRANFNSGYFQNNSLTHADKFISSIKMHLAKSADINKMTCDAIIEGLSNICSSKS